MEWITIDHLAAGRHVCGRALLIYLAVEKNYGGPSSADGLRCDPCESPGQRCIKPVYGGQPVRLMESSSGSFESGIEASEAFPLLLFIGIGAMIDFECCFRTRRCSSLVQRPSSASFLRSLWHHFSFDIKDAASIGIIGAADGQASILVSQVLKSNYIGAIAVAACSPWHLCRSSSRWRSKRLRQKKNV